jgi:hypothetical protein
MPRGLKVSRPLIVNMILVVKIQQLTSLSEKKVLHYDI